MAFLEGPLDILTALRPTVMQMKHSQCNCKYSKHEWANERMAAISQINCEWKLLISFSFMTLFLISHFSAMNRMHQKVEENVRERSFNNLKM